MQLSSNIKETTATDLHKQSEVPPTHRPRDTVKVFLKQNSLKNVCKSLKSCIMTSRHS